MSVSAPARAARHAVGAQWPWIAPIALAAFIYETQGAYVERAVAALLAAIVVLLAARRPDRSLLILIAGLPFQGFVLAQLYAWGAPGELVRPLSSWKEALALGVVVAGIRGYRAGSRRLDRLDALALAYIAIVGAYAAAPGLFAPGAPGAANARSLAFRASAGFVMLLLAARHARLPRDFVSRAARVVMIAGAAVAAIELYEYFFSAAWNRFVIDRIGYLRYQVQILHTTPFSLTDIRRYSTIGGHRVVRTGSVFLDPTTCGFFLVLPFAVAVERRLRAARGHGTGATVAVFLIGAGLILTQTRAALIAVAVVTLLALRPAAGRSTNRRVQLALIFAAGLVVAVPAATATGLSHRVATTATAADPSSTDHERSFWDSLDIVESRPLGHGVGTSAGVGQRFDNRAATIAENSYLEVGIETGVVAMGVFVLLSLVLLTRLRRGSRAVADAGISAVFSAGAGLAVGAFFLQAWTDFSVAWSFWALAGAALALAERPAYRGENDHVVVERELSAAR